MDLRELTDEEIKEAAYELSFDATVLDKRAVLECAQGLVQATLLRRRADVRGDANKVLRSPEAVARIAHEMRKPVEWVRQHLADAGAEDRVTTLIAMQDAADALALQQQEYPGEQFYNYQLPEPHRDILAGPVAFAVASLLMDKYLRENPPITDQSYNKLRNRLARRTKELLLEEPLDE